MAWGAKIMLWSVVGNVAITHHSVQIVLCITTLIPSNKKIVTIKVVGLGTVEMPLNSSQALMLPFHNNF